METLATLIPKEITDPTFNEDCIGYCLDYNELFDLDRGTVFVPKDGTLKYIGVLRKTRLELIEVDNPFGEWVKLKEQYSLPKVNKARLEFIKKQRVYYKDLGIHPLACIGDEGMGYEWEDGWVEFPQRGGVKIGADVRIGAFSSVKKATMDGYYTEIGDGCKIGSHCNIGHNVKMGKHCLLTHRVSIAGSCEIGDRVFFGQGCIIKNKVKIGSGAIIGQGANVLKDVPPNTTVTGIWK